MGPVLALLAGNQAECERIIARARRDAGRLAAEAGTEAAAIAADAGRRAAAAREEAARRVMAAARDGALACRGGGPARLKARGLRSSARSGREGPCWRGSLVMPETLACPGGSLVAGVDVRVRHGGISCG